MADEPQREYSDRTMTKGKPSVSLAPLRATMSVDASSQPNCTIVAPSDAIRNGRALARRMNSSTAPTSPASTATANSGSYQLGNAA
ncbi:hypothetical protein C8J45_103410 [Sphingomonas sp. PP-CE-3G-477]|uniref:hypothetical protein n=1 Tax=Sphingomonas sp. PP-CE-3G-477 TaxID=2135660 RepID=UPI000D453262|nr:hypothetical protein [Sphingomonas sp. PP-CE-3G-477]PTQ64560.1 hypothetical protein C8J45_103410 [Sphingomonas sp. PP-CE-3G-477]